MEKSLSKDSKITMILLSIGATIGTEIFIYFYRALALSSNIEILSFARILIVESLYNGILTIIIYPLMQKFGYKIEHIFKEPQILTRYF